ncbi:replication protein A 70 kDa DNA-binding subunit A-like protein [Tanacetum coccineum]
MEGTTINLTPGAISKLLTGDHEIHLRLPVVQVIDIKRIGNQIKVVRDGVEKKECYKIVFSDGSTFDDDVDIGDEINELVRTKQLEKGSIVQLTHYCSSGQGDIISISVLSLTVICSKCDIIGDPKPFPRDTTFDRDEDVDTQFDKV